MWLLVPMWATLSISYCMVCVSFSVTQWHTNLLNADNCHKQKKPSFMLIYIHKEKHSPILKQSDIYLCVFCSFYTVQLRAFLDNDSLHQPIMCSLIQPAWCWLALPAHSHHSANLPLCATTTTEKQHFTAPRHTVHDHTSTIHDVKKTSVIKNVISSHIQVYLKP